MKFTKMSLVAALLIGSSAFAIDNVKVSGDAKLYYATDDAKTDGIAAAGTASDSLFNAGSSAGQAALGLGITADLTKNVSAGVHTTILTTLGLQGQLVNNVWEGTNGTTDSWIVDEAWIAGTVGNTTGKIGRMELDTPLVFSEKWSIVANTFEAAVVINKDVPDTTLVGAYVGGSNSATGLTGVGNATPGVGYTNRIQTIASESTFNQFYNGAFAIGAINNSFKPLTVQAWYYDAPQYVDAIWLQADLDTADLGVKGLTVGAQYTKINYNQSDDLTAAISTVTQDSDNDAYAFKVGYAMEDLFTASIAYSATGDDNTNALGAGQNLATLNNGTQSKLYTEAWWNYGYVTRNDTNAWNVTVTSPVQGMFDLGLYYTSTTTKKTAPATDIDMTEFTLTAGKDFGPLNTTVAYIYTNADDQNIETGNTQGSAFNTVQVYLTYNF